MEILKCILVILPLVHLSTCSDDINYRLSPGIVSPTLYTVTLTLPNDVFTSNEFSGSSTLIFTQNVASDEVKLHAKNLVIPINGVHLSTGTGTVIPLISPAKYESDPVTDILTIKAAQTLAVGGTYSLTITYTATLVDDEMYGFYKSSYTEGGATKYLATTQFQPNHARKAFPCLDEPSFKAQFKITLIFSKDYEALGNTPIFSDTTDSTTNARTVIFTKTPVMSTYLVAFTISQFTCSDGADIPNEPKAIPYKVCSREGASNTRNLAVDLGPKLLKDLESFTGITYGSSNIGKMDQLAIPDFAAGAMENWGIVTFRETALLWDDIESSDRYKQRVATVIAHEFSHMWFGDLVTTHWWSDTFLNEGFATFFEYKTTGNIFPDWELEKQFVLEQLQPVLRDDALITSKPLSYDVSSPAEISSRFDSISYNKGGSVLRMVESFMGAVRFKYAIGQYLNANKFKNTDPTILWDALGTYTSDLPAGTTLANIMENWTQKAGFPLLQVTSSGNDVTVTQSRFLITGEDTTTWYVPISYTVSNDSNNQKFAETKPKAWLSPTQSLVLKEALHASEWIILNNQQTGYYRVNYDGNLWEKISIGLRSDNFDGIHVLNRAQIVDDLFNLAQVGAHNYSTVLKIVEFLRSDTEYYPWSSAFNAFSMMRRRIGNQNVLELLSNHILYLMGNLYDSVSPFDIENTSNQIYIHKKVLALTWACNLGAESCIDNSLDIFATYKITGIRPNKNLRTVVYCNALRKSAKIAEDWDFLWNKYLATTVATEQVTILSALGCTNNKEVLNGYLTKSITANSGIRSQDALSVFSAVYTGSPEGVDIALDFLIANVATISEYYKSMNSMSSLIKGLANRFTVQTQLDKLGVLLGKTGIDESLKKAGEEALSAAAANLESSKVLEDQLMEFFTEHKSLASSVKANIVTAIITTMLLVVYRLSY